MTDPSPWSQYLDRLSAYDPIAEERRHHEAAGRVRVRESARTRRTYFIIVCCLAVAVAIFVATPYLPLVLAPFGLSDRAVGPVSLGLVTALVLVAVALYIGVRLRGSAAAMEQEGPGRPLDEAEIERLNAMCREVPELAVWVTRWQAGGRALNRTDLGWIRDGVKAYQHAVPDDGLQAVGPRPGG